MPMNEKQRREFERCRMMGKRARNRGDREDSCPFDEGGHSINVAEAGDPPRYVQTVAYMRGGWMGGFRSTL